MSKKWFVPFIIGTFLSTCFLFNTKIIREDKEHSESNINFSELKKVEKKKTARVNFSKLPVPNYVIAPDFGGDWIDCEDVAFHQNHYFDIKTYFQNLYTYSPANDVGSCGYVSLIQAMSYYDTFYNDTIIPEIYDKHKLDATSIDDVKSYSPGTLWQHYDSSTYDTYYNFCHSTQWTNFQSYLTVLFNYNNSTDNPSDFDPSLAGWQYGELFNYLYGYFSGIYTTEYSDETQNEYEQNIKSIIDSGNPAIVHIKRYNQSSGTYSYHSVVAYDYDENNIYANFGYGQGSTHSQLIGGTFGYDEIYFAVSLNFSSLMHSHSDNYVSYGDAYCGCNLNDHVIIDHYNNWYNVPPTIYWMKNTNDPGESYIISFRSSPGGENIDWFETSNNQVTIPFNMWKAVVTACNNVVYVALERISCTTGVFYNETITQIEIPSSSLTTKTLVPTDYGFQDSYPTSSNVSDNYYHHYMSDGFKFRTRRYRTGYIHNEYIVMSCIKTEITEAFIEFAFNFPITRIDVDMAHWRELSYEWLDSSSGVAELQIWQQSSGSGQWVQYFNFLSPGAAMSRDRTNPSNYQIYFNQPVFGFRFYSAINSPMTSQVNRGRVCIGDLKLYIGE